MKPTKFSSGINFAKKPGLSKPDAAKRKPIFGGDDSDDDAPNGTTGGATAIAISGLDDISSSTSSKPSSQSSRSKPKPGPPTHPPKSKLGSTTTQFGDLSSSLTSRKYAEDAEKLDPSIYDYDASYDTFKAPAKAAKDSAERKKPQYMSNVKKMAEVRERDRRIAEDRKMQREREAEGDEFADKEKFVTEAYKKQQEENRRLEEEEKRREELEAKSNKSGGMTGFYKDLLDREDQRQAEIQKAAEQLHLKGSKKDEGDKEEEAATRTDADLARMMNERGGDVAINDEGQVVDKRQLLKGGLNVGAKKKSEVQKEAAERKAAGSSNQDHGRGVFAGGSKQSMRDRQSRMLEAQYEQALKRSRDEEEEERQKVESASKSRKTEGEISSAKERYLARKRAEAEAKKNGTVEAP